MAIQPFFKLYILVPERMREEVEANTVCSSLEKPLNLSVFETPSGDWGRGCEGADKKVIIGGDVNVSPHLAVW